MRHYLVVANRTLDNHALDAWVAGRLAKEAVHLHLVVPATRVEGRIHWSDEEATDIARRRLDQARRRLRDLGALVSGEIGPADPVVAAADALARCPFDVTLVSTLPPAESDWLRQGVIARMQQSLRTPVLHLPDGDPAGLAA